MRKAGAEQRIDREHAALDAQAGFAVVKFVEIGMRLRERLLFGTWCVAEAAEVVRAVDHPALRTMIDCSAAGATEAQSVPELIDAWLPTGLIAHVQVNDPNRRAPGQGEMKFQPIFAALKRNGYDATVAVEPFDYVPDGPGAAAFAAGYLRGVRESLA